MRGYVAAVLGEMVGRNGDLPEHRALNAVMAAEGAGIECFALEALARAIAEDRLAWN